MKYCLNGYHLFSAPQFGTVGPMKKQKGKGVSKCERSKSTAVNKKRKNEDNINSTEKHSNKIGKTSKPDRIHKTSKDTETKVKATKNVETDKNAKTINPGKIDKTSKGNETKVTATKNIEKMNSTAKNTDKNEKTRNPYRIHKTSKGNETKVTTTKNIDKMNSAGKNTDKNGKTRNPYRIHKTSKGNETKLSQLLTNKEIWQKDGRSNKKIKNQIKDQKKMESETKLFKKDEKGKSEHQ